MVFYRKRDSSSPNKAEEEERDALPKEGDELVKLVVFAFS